MMTTQVRACLSPHHAYHDPLSLHRQQFHPTSTHSTGQTSDFLNSTNAYMNPTLPQPPLQYPSQSSSHHGIKRSASDPDDDFEQSSHISNHFKKLRLNNKQPSQSNTSYQGTQQNVQATTSQTETYGTGSGTAIPPQHQTVSSLPFIDFMTIDETPHKIYIPDLDSEIASIEAAERTSSQLFLPDFEKQIGAIPDHVLRSNPSGYRGDVGESSNTNQQALVLYNDPVSISVPAEEDAVRKAILEARRGIREKMRKEQQKERETAHVDLGIGWGVNGLLGPMPSFSSGNESKYDREGYEMEDGHKVLNDYDAMEIE